MRFKDQLRSLFATSVVWRGLTSATRKLSAFFAAGKLWQWMTGADEGRQVGWLTRFIDSKFCDFFRSSTLLGWLTAVPELPWLCLMLTGLSALLMPTLVVMLLSLVTFVLTVMAVIFRKEKLPLINSGVAAWALFALVTLAFTLCNYGGLKGVLAGGIRFCMLPSLPSAWILLSKAGRVKKTALVFTAGVAAVGLYGLYQYFAGAMSSLWTDTEMFSEDFGRLTSTFENPNVYGTFLLLGLPIALVSLLTAKRKRERLFYALTSAVALINFVLTYSRGCYVSMVLILFILLLCYGRNWLWAGVGALAAMPFCLPESVLQRVMSIGNLADTSVSYRISIWEGALKMLEHCWWSGVGIGDTAFVAVYDYTALDAIEAPHAHNLLLQTICESGVLGLIALIALFVCLFRTAMSSTCRESGQIKWWRLALIACWSGLLVQGLTDYIFYNNNLFVIMLISMGAMIAQPKEEGNYAE
ncbi:MAG: O-antigen ligase family protein [Clostridia bacterium]|nr:O-antigen ligase family protein [Clostridia bacterium]